jgi:transcriptional regulator with XRE-family HTH domain
MIGNRIKELYKALQLTQYQFADIVGVSHSAISQIQSGKNKPSKRLLIAIYAKFPRINPAWLESGKGEMFIKDEFPEVVREKAPRYGIPENCPADPVCQQICIYCMGLPPDDRKTTLSLLEILTSGRESTKSAIRQNISEFHELIKRSDQETDFKTLERKRSGGK